MCHLCVIVKKGYLKVQTKSTIIASQNQALYANNMKIEMYGNGFTLCRMYREKVEAVAHLHIVSEASTEGVCTKICLK